MKSCITVLFIFFSFGFVLAQTDTNQFEERKYTKSKNIDPALGMEFNVGFGILDVESVTMAGIQGFYGAKFNEKLILGGGFGIHLYEAERFLPLFVEGRYLMGVDQTRFMIGTSLGAYWGWEQSIWQQYFNPYMGFAHKAFDHVELTISIGLIYKPYEVRLEPVRLPGGGFSNVSGTEEVIGRFFSIRFGCQF